MTTWEANIEHAGRSGRPQLLVNRSDKEQARQAFAFIFDVPASAVKVREVAGQ